MTLTGTGFTGATQVDFGAKLATNVVVNAAGTQITATSPAAASGGIVNVTVTGPSGTSSTSSADQFDYVTQLWPFPTTATGMYGEGASIVPQLR